MSDLARVAIVGPGAIADVHARALRDAGARAQVAAGTSLARAQAFAERHGIPRAVDDPAAAIMADDVDIVMICSPHDAHADQAELAIEAGKHVLVEIPLAMSLRDGERLVALSRQRGVRLGVCHTLRFHEALVAAREAVRACPSAPSLIAARRLMLRVDDVGWTGRQRSWADSLLWHHGAHVVDAVRMLAGADLVVVGAAAGHRAGGRGEPLDYALTLRSADGTAISVALSYTSREPVNDMVVTLPDDTLVVTPCSARTTARSLAAADEQSALDDAVARQDREFVACVREGTPYAADAHDIVETLRLLDDAQRMAMGAPAPASRVTPTTLGQRPGPTEEDVRSP